MKLFVAIFFVASATAGRLDNTYLPPGSPGPETGNATVVATLSTLLPSNSSASPASLYTVPVAATYPYGYLSSPSILYRAPVAPTRFTGTVSAPVALSGVYAAGYPGQVYPPVPILRSNHYINADRSYSFDYETANHIAVQESGRPKAADSFEVQGSYSYLAPNGQIISLRYIADENGFRPVGEHLPTPPPIPAAILKSLEFNAAEAARGIVDDGQYHPTIGELVAAGRYVTPSVSSQYLPPVTQVTQGGYKY